MPDMNIFMYQIILEFKNLRLKVYIVLFDINPLIFVVYFEKTNLFDIFLGVFDLNNKKNLQILSLT